MNTVLAATSRTISPALQRAIDMPDDDPKKQAEIAGQIGKVASKAAADRAQTKAELKADDAIQRLDKAITDSLKQQEAASK